MKILIIGAGISGFIAAGAFDEMYDVTIVDAAGEKSTPFADHKAVLRLRSDEIKNYVDCSLRQITARKQVLHDGILHDSPTSDMNRSYSLKCYKRVGKRSLNELGYVKRFEIENISLKERYKIQFKKQVVQIGSDRQVLFADGSKATYDVCISSMPLPSMLNAVYGVAKRDMVPVLKSRPVFIKRCRLSRPINENRTIYFTQPDFPYRATIAETVLIVESMHPIRESDTQHVADVFGLSQSNLTDWSTHKQSYGKIIPLKTQIRQYILEDLSERFSIYSLGRFAIWKPIRVDQVVSHMQQIMALIRNRPPIFGATTRYNYPANNHFRSILMS